MTGRLRILFTIPNFITAGSGGAMLNIIRRLDRDLFEPAVGVLRKGGALDRTVTEMGIPLIEAPFVLDAKPYSSLLRRQSTPLMCSDLTISTYGIPFTIRMITQSH